VRRFAIARGSSRSVDRSRSIALVIGLVAVIAGCGGDDAGDGSQATVSSADASATIAAAVLSTGPSATPTIVPTPSFGDVVWATEVDPQTKAPVGAVEAFASDASALYAVVPVRNLPENTTLTAEWTYNETSLDGLTSTATTVSTIEDGWVEFHLIRAAETWPDGTYAITVRVDGQAVQTAEVAVERR
jgi:hypothetical protein